MRTVNRNRSRLAGDCAFGPGWELTLVGRAIGSGEGFQAMQVDGGERRPEREPHHDRAGALMLAAYAAALVASGAGITLLFFGLALIGALLLTAGISSAATLLLFGRRRIEREIAFLSSPGPIPATSVSRSRRLILRTGLGRSRTVAIRINDPELLPDLCAHLSRRGFRCRPRDPAEAEVFLSETLSPVAAELDLVMKIALWQERRPGTEVAIDS